MRVLSRSRHPFGASAPNQSQSSRLVVACLAALAAASAVACDTQEPPEPAAQVAEPTSVATEIAAPESTSEPQIQSEDAGAPAADEPEEPQPWEGPFFAVTRTSTGVYSEPRKERRLKIGYVEEGGRVPIHPDTVEGKNCSKGWYRVVSGGFICANTGTTNLSDPRVKFAKRPDLEAILPYRYARNAYNGTPLYRSVPSAEQIRNYEPWRFASEKPSADRSPSRGASPSSAKPTQKSKPTQDQRASAKERGTSDPPASKPGASRPNARKDEEAARRRAALAAARRAMLGEAAAKKLEAEGARLEPPAAAPAVQDAGGAPKKEWWQQEDPKLNELSIEDLQAGDDVLAMRMIKGFYVAVARSFKWQGRRWYRSTKGFVAPADRFHLTAGSEFQGVELDDTWRLPIGWTYGFQKTKPTFTIDEESGQLQRKGTVKRFEALNLTGQEREINKRTYVETVDGLWLRRKDLRITRPGPPPEEITEGERWIDINLDAQTLVLFEGDKPLYATMMSSGKRHKDKAKDHRTPTGQWRIQTKHIATTMDGDGTAAGDLPYSIEGVPYAMYFHRSYAVHGAFWHRNYGIRMSHGCINLSPLDAKHVFFNTEPPVPEGLHGAWSNEQRPGSLVVVHR